MRIQCGGALLAVALLIGCASKSQETNASNEAPPAQGANDAGQLPAAASSDVSPESADILARYPATEYAVVRHILISWTDKAPTYEGRGGQDPRGTERTKGQANALAASLVARAKSGTPFDELMADYSEDRGSAASGRTYTATPTASLVAPFRALSLRLNPNEIGVVETDFGYHIIERVE